ncbi:MAG: hypothetical protein NTX59_02760 [Elusimicrobia bacterium]|nr:hypothetical protein [Elusimicrobiota bacterium]
MAEDNDNAVLHVNQPGQAPRAIVFLDKTQRPLTPAEAKRARFIKNLKNNYARLNEALAFFEYFAAICELSLERRESIRKANKEAIDELSRNFEDKLAEYDRRRKGVV